MNNNQDKTRMVHIRLTDDRVRQLKVRAAMEDSSITKLVEQAVDRMYFSDEADAAVVSEPAKPKTSRAKPKAKSSKAKSPPTKPHPTSRRSQPSGVEETKPSDNLALNVVPNPFAAE